MNILIVDDEYYIVKGIEEKINWAKLGIGELHTAFDSEQAKEIFRTQGSIDLLLVDIEMPNGNGLELIEWAHAHGYKPISLILTGHEQFDYARKAVNLHCYSYLLKPVNYGILEEELKSAIESMSINIKETSDAAAPIARAKGLISKRLGDASLSRTEIADYVHLNPDYLSYVFHKEEGLSLSLYILRERLELSKKLLTSTSLSIDEISERTGFSNQSYFSKQFKRFLGLTPGQYRQLHG